MSTAPKRSIGRKQLERVKWTHALECAVQSAEARDFAPLLDLLGDNTLRREPLDSWRRARLLRAIDPASAKRDLAKTIAAIKASDFDSKERERLIDAVKKSNRGPPGKATHVKNKEGASVRLAYRVLRVLGSYQDTDITDRRYQETDTSTDDTAIEMLAKKLHVSESTVNRRIGLNKSERERAVTMLRAECGHDEKRLAGLLQFVNQLFGI